MRKTVFAILFFCAALSAQSPLGIRYPLGMPLPTGTGTAMAMGGSGAAVIDEYLGTGLNPANVAIGERAAFSALISFDLTHVSDNGSHDITHGYTPNLISLILPVGQAGNFGFSMEKQYEAGLNFYTSERLENGKDLVVNKIELQRKGGLTAWQAGWGYRFGNGWSFGLAYERLYFNRDSRIAFESTFRYELDSGAVSFREYVTQSEELKFASDGFRFGIQIPVHEKVTLGAAAEYIMSGNENGYVTHKYRRSDQPSPTVTPEEEKFSINLPPSINIGISYAPDERWLLVADAFSVLWERYINDFEKTSAYRTFGISAGGRLIPAAGRLVSTYPEKIHYSAGLRYATLPHDGKGNGGAHEYALTAGTSLPIPNNGGLIDLVLCAGRRTDARYSGYAENFVQFKLGINGGRSWFQKDASKDY
jgi:long-subunit fatty acid transport protein